MNLFNYNFAVRESEEDFGSDCGLTMSKSFVCSSFKILYIFKDHKNIMFKMNSE